MKKLIYLGFALAFSMSACVRNENKKDNSSAKEKTSSEETKTVDGYKKISELSQKNPNSPMAQLFSKLDKGQEVNFNDLTSSITSSKSSVKFEINNLKLESNALAGSGIKSNVDSIDFGVSVYTEQDKEGDSYVKMSLKNSDSLDKLLKDAMSSEQIKQLITFVPELKDLSTSKINMEGIVLKNDSVNYLKSDLIDLIIKDAKDKWVQISKSSSEPLTTYFNMDLTNTLQNVSGEEKLSYKYYGEETIDGEKAEHYRIFIDFDKIKDLKNISDKDLKTLKNNFNVKFEVWVNKDFEMLKGKVYMKIKFTQDLIDAMNNLSKNKTSEDESNKILIGSEIVLEASSESYKNAKVSAPSDYISETEFSDIFYRTPFGSLMKLGQSS